MNITLREYIKKYLNPNDRVIVDYHFACTEFNENGNLCGVFAKDGLQVFKRDDEYSFRFFASEIDKFDNTYEWFPEIEIDFDNKRFRHDSYFIYDDYIIYRVSVDSNQHTITELHIIVFRYY